VTAPAGGLHVVPRDVNGDNALDLLVSTAWLHQPVAVLVNDGHGYFTLFDPVEFRGITWDPESSWNSTSEESRDAVAAILLRNLPGDCAESGFISPGQFRAWRVSADSGHPVFSAAFPVFGRAPPAGVMEV
jgi:hypothetical protein